MCSIVVHPSKQSVRLFEILQGKYSYVTGQTLYNAVRNPGVFFRQLFIYLYKTALASCTYDDVLLDWTRYESSVRKRWSREQYDDYAFRISTFQSWYSTMKMTVDELVVKNMNFILHSKSILSYERYVDWVMTLGIVPIVRKGIDRKVADRIKTCLRKDLSFFSQNNKSLTSILESMKLDLLFLLEKLTSVYIPSFLEVTVEYDPIRGTYSGTYQNKQVDVEVVNLPTIGSGQFFFDSPLQRMYESIMACHRATEHAKICQLLNTGPLKAIVSSSCANVYKDILNHLEESGKKSDPKKELMQLLIKLAENKTVNGVSDVVEDFVSDVSQKMVDRTKLFGDNTAETTFDGLKKQVSNNIFRCLTHQINEQFDTIHKLEEEREFFIRKINQIENQLSQVSDETRQGCPSVSEGPFNLLTMDTMTALSGLQYSGTHLTSSQIPKGQSVVNSFYSQYVPPFRELIKDLTNLWEHEIIQSFKLAPVVDNQGQRLCVRYTQDTISILLGPFTYMIAGLNDMELLRDSYSDLNFLEITEYLYSVSRLAIYISDIGWKYCAIGSYNYGVDNVQALQ
ncbi:capsid protein [Porcine lymphotropic herpesvirus 3]|uniref:Capsid protein n=1 Tax=Suid gammaherpesvirus 5 TaxID=1960251 RepID=Q8B3X9_9GAMA|nr:capsid protein [Porcine lymphotropic herpesvirus 3]AAO12346.1 capsid protein [Porcine lymphotropic herpesvirus 3]